MSNLKKKLYYFDLKLESYELLKFELHENRRERERCGFGRFGNKPRKFRLETMFQTVSLDSVFQSSGFTFVQLHFLITHFVLLFIMKKFTLKLCS